MRKRESCETNKPFSRVSETLEPCSGVEKRASRASYESARGEAHDPGESQASQLPAPYCIVVLNSAGQAGRQYGRASMHHPAEWLVRACNRNRITLGDRRERTLVDKRQDKTQWPGECRLPTLYWRIDSAGQDDNSSRD